MAGKVLEVESILRPDQMGCTIAQNFMTWDTFRKPWKDSVNEVRKYVYATDTRHTTNNQNPWRNTTTIPKLCQIRDNLHANYFASLFPKRKWLIWDADTEEASVEGKRVAITNYMKYVIAQRQFKEEMTKCLLDYIDYGNVFASVEWEDQRVEQKDKTQAGYVGPVVRRWSPLDIVFNPIASSFDQSPKIVRSLITFGELKEYLSRLSTDDNRVAYEELYSYMKETRRHVSEFVGDVQYKDAIYNIDGFSSYKDYLGSNYVEVLTFYGDLYDTETDEFLKNYVITVVDRHKVIDKRPNESWFGRPPFFHVGWRKRQDNLWAMGPLDNLVGMQYRIDHVENLKADVFDFNAAPPLKVKGYVRNFEWRPFERINMDEDGDVEAIKPDYQILQANVEIQNLMDLMEEMAGSPKEAMGFRTPGEKTKYEVQRLENAASRIFSNKIMQFEESFVEPILNAMLELARRNFTTGMSVKVFDRDEDIISFMEISPEDIAGPGRIRPIAARHFAEQAEQIQNITNFYGSALAQDPDIKMHFSSVRIAKMVDSLLDTEDFEIYRPYVRLSEQAEMQKMQNSMLEQVQMQAMTPSGLSEDDSDAPLDLAGLDAQQMV